jgi:hypothetical protein
LALSRVGQFPVLVQPNPSVEGCDQLLSSRRCADSGSYDQAGLNRRRPLNAHAAGTTSEFGDRSFGVGRLGAGGLGVSPQAIAVLLRRHIAAVLVVLAIAASVGYALRRAPVQYQDSATMVFTAPPSAMFPNPLGSLSGTVIDTAGTMAVTVMSPEGQQDVQRAGGTTSYEVELVNSYNIEYPNFSYPDVTITANAASPGEAQHTFNLVTQILMRELLLNQAGVLPIDRISARVIGATGPQSQQGSAKRVFAGLLTLTIVAIFSVACFLDRHPIRIHRLWAADGHKYRLLSSRGQLGQLSRRRARQAPSRARSARNRKNATEGVNRGSFLAIAARSAGRVRAVDAGAPSVCSSCVTVSAARTRRRIRSGSVRGACTTAFACVTMARSPGANASEQARSSASSGGRLARRS